MSSTNDGAALKQVHDAYQDLYNKLTSAFWAATTIENKDRIHGVMDLVFEILTALNRASLEASSPEFAAIGAKVKATNDQLTALKGEIGKLIAAITTATQVAATIDQALALAGKFFAL